MGFNSIKYTHVMEKIQAKSQAILALSLKLNPSKDFQNLSS